MPSRRELANAIRALSMDAVQQANSGHPGMPMGMADIAEVLWNDFHRHNPANPNWVNRDRFVVSNGHGSMLLYSLLHLAGYDLPLEELKNFRQLHSKTAGHPEFGEAPGIETTTGPLGQGIANAVGMALAERLLAAEFNQGDHNIVDHRTWVLLGDGCLMEGISHEACSLAGTLGLGKLIAIYDDNDISIDGDVDGWFRDDTPMRFESYGWNVIRDVDGHDADAVKAALEKATEDDSKPTLICCKTVIGWGAPNKQGTEGVHGAALGDDEVAAARKTLDWPHPPFEVPEDIRNAWQARERGAAAEAEWNQRFEAYEKQHPDLADALRRRMAGELAGEFEGVANKAIATAQAESKTMATRKSSKWVLDALAPIMPEFLGGSADLTGSNLTNFDGFKAVTPDDVSGNYIYFGVREFGMTAILNGVALHGGFVPFSGTFLTFSDYARNAVRMAALMKQRNIMVYTHDSIGLGEDGPTHQSVEHVASLRLIPDLDVWRPCDTAETAVAWKVAIKRADGPSALALTRQNVEPQARDGEQVANIARGGYILRDCEGEPELILIATGSEVPLATGAAEVLAEDGRRVRVVSMPCADIFDRQDDMYRDSVLPPSVTARLAVEAGVTAFWHRYVGAAGAVVGIDQYGLSAPGGQVMEYFGFTVANVTSVARRLLADR